MDDVYGNEQVECGINYKGVWYPGFKSMQEAERYIDSQPGWREGGAVARQLPAKKKRKAIAISDSDREGLTVEMRRLTTRIGWWLESADETQPEDLLKLLPPIDDVAELKKAIGRLLDLYFVADEFQAWQKLKSGENNFGRGE